MMPEEFIVKDLWKR